MEKRHFISFCFPSNEQLQEKSEQNDWLERMIFIYTDLKWLLSLSVDDFWNQVLYDDSWHSCLDSFLQFSPRSYDLRNVPDGCKVALSRVSRMFLLVLKRMSDYNEKFEKGEYGEIIYENFVFDAAKLFDTCSIFYCANNDKVKDILHQIMLNIFECQSNYFNDLSNSVQTLILTLQTIEERIKVSKPNHQLKPINGREAQNMVLYVYDLVNTVSAFLNVFNDSSQVFYQSNVCNSLVAFCENTLPALLELIEIKVGKYRYLCKQIDDVSTKFVQLVIQKAFVESKPSQREDGSLYHLYTSLMDSISECPRFLARYCELGSIQNELEKIVTFEGVDISCLQYLKDIVCTSVQENLDDETFDKLKELLPTKSDTYLKTCIESCGHDVSVIMNNIMEGKIEDPEAEPPKEIKMPHVPDATFLDDNREHVAMLKASLLPGPEDCVRDYEMYEDEYDDTYDTQNIAAADADSADEIIYRRKFTIPAILRQAGDVTPENSDEEEAEENPQENRERSESNDNRNENNNGGRGGGSRGHHRGRGGGRSGRGNSRGRGGGGPVRGSSGRGGGQQGGNSGGGDSRGRGGGDSRGRGGGGRGDSRGSRGRGRGNKRNHKSMADKKHSKGMMPF